MPFPASFSLPPTAMIVPSSLKLTLYPELSPAASPSISPPSWMPLAVYEVKATLESSPPEIDNVGVAVIASLKAAVMVTVSEAAIRLSVSVSDKITVGVVWADRLKLANKNNN